MSWKINSGEVMISENSQVAASAPVWIVYGTHTGNSMELAEETAARVSKLGLSTEVCDMDDFKTEYISEIEKLLIIVSTDGEGDPPLMAEELLEFFQSDKAPELTHLSYSVLALGDTTYTFFCKAGKDFDSTLAKLGARKLAERVDCDVDYEEGYDLWIENVLSGLKCSKEN